MGKNVFVQGQQIDVILKGGEEFISLTDIARFKNSSNPRFVIINWLRNKNTLAVLRIWECIHNNKFNRVEFDTVTQDAGLNSFTISPSKLVSKTKLKSIISKSGKHSGGTFAHIDIALEFASWISPEFKIYLIKEFRRLKEQEFERLRLSWDVKREFAKINYEIHTNAIKENLIPPEVSKKDAKQVYATEADLLNKAIFGMTAQEWTENNQSLKGNLRDFANATQLVVLANLESLNAEFIKEGLEQEQRIAKLNKVAIAQMIILTNSHRTNMLREKKVGEKISK